LTTARRQKGVAMAEIDLTGKVAIVTGAGRGIGRAYALLLAERGAAVVVADPGVQTDGRDGDAGVADAVVKEIVVAGGRAAASAASVTTPEGGAEIVRTATDEFGQVDLLVHNAGVVYPCRFAEQPMEQVRATFDVHVFGAWHVGQPAWRQMEAQGYGRIVFTSSMAQFGHFRQPAYAAAKTAVIGLTKSLSHDAIDKGLNIRVNAICPLAGTRLALPAAIEGWGELMDPANVAAVVAYLVSDECAVTGQIVHAGGSHAALGFLGQTKGWYKGAPRLTPEEVRGQWDAVVDMTDYELPANASDQMQLVERTVLGHVIPVTTHHPLEKG
jgi:NAD(P)-dependent dehydrogenase (short-subunit alcohol dehydrogenase family)